MKCYLQSRSITLIYDFSSSSSSTILVESISWLCASDIHEISNHVGCRDICAENEEDKHKTMEATKTTKTTKTMTQTTETTKTDKEDDEDEDDDEDDDKPRIFTFL